MARLASLALLALLPACAATDPPRWQTSSLGGFFYTRVMGADSREDGEERAMSELRARAEWQRAWFRRECADQDGELVVDFGESDCEGGGLVTCQMVEIVSCRRSSEPAGIVLHALDEHDDETDAP
jgi:hypothetical protein